MQRAIYAAAALAGVRGSEPGVEKATGVSRHALRRLFAGGEPGGDILKRIAAGLDTTAEALLAAREGRAPEVGLERIANEIVGLRDALLDRATIRAAISERRHSASGLDLDPPVDDGLDDEPGRRRA